MLTVTVLGITAPDSRPLFVAALAVHVLAGMTSVGAGGLAATARKGPGRHPLAGRVYLFGLAAIFVTASVMAAMRWRHDWHLFVIATVTAGAGTFGYLARRRARPGWMVWHGSAMGSSYIALLTGFYVDNGPQLPVWDRLPHIAYWFLPALVGVPLIVRALFHNGALPRSRRLHEVAGVQR
ncbi:MAG TPA: hypothetical protein VFE14_09300 [Micromonosporaceae bacterium]|nr:hypothetical protein [Micromonosporaceae bacterium]